MCQSGMISLWEGLTTLWAKSEMRFVTTFVKKIKSRIEQKKLVYIVGFPLHSLFLEEE
jgi:hypothetical protein